MSNPITRVHAGQVGQEPAGSIVSIILEILTGNKQAYVKQLSDSRVRIPSETSVAV